MGGQPANRNAATEPGGSVAMTDEPFTVTPPSGWATTARGWSKVLQVVTFAAAITCAVGKVKARPARFSSSSTGDSESVLQTVTLTAPSAPSEAVADTAG